MRGKRIDHLKPSATPATLPAGEPVLLEGYLETFEVWETERPHRLLFSTDDRSFAARYVAHPLIARHAKTATTTTRIYLTLQCSPPRPT